MNKKPGKPPPQESKADKIVDSDHPADDKGTATTLRPAGEGPDNLRQRAEWFRRRQGGDK